MYEVYLGIRNYCIDFDVMLEPEGIVVKVFPKRAFISMPNAEDIIIYTFCSRGIWG